MDPPVLFIMIDGIGDSSNSILQGKTYLQVSKTPNLDNLVNNGLTGVMDPVETGLACGSDTAHMSIFGYNPLKLYQGRGSFETMGSGLSLNDNEIAFKCNFATLNTQTGIVTKRRVSRKFYQWGLPMIDSINNIKIEGFEDYKISVKHATEHRCGLKITGPGLTYRIEGTDPLKDNLPLLAAIAWDPSDLDSVKTAEIVNAANLMIHKILELHPLNIERIAHGKSPANVLLLRGAGVRLKVKSFDEIYGVKSFFIAPTAIIKGWGMTIGSDIVDVDGATGDVRSNHWAKFEKAVEMLQSQYNFGFLHVKAIDDLGHDRNITDRISLFERIDGMIGETVKKLGDCVVVVTGDHSTNAYIGDHSHEAVPFLMAWARDFGKKQGDLEFNEIDCAKGALGRFPGSQVMKMIFRFRDSNEKL